MDSIYLVNLVSIDTTIEEVVKDIYAEELLASTAVILEPTLHYVNDVMFIASWHAIGSGENLKYVLFLADDDTIYQSSISIGTSGNYTSEQRFEEFSEIAEEILHEIIMLNMERSGQ